MNQCTPDSGTLLADDERTYTLTLDPDGSLLLDGQVASLIVELSMHAPLTLVTPTILIRCTPSAF